MKITVVCEHNASMDSKEGVAAYPEGLGVCLKGVFGEAGYETTLVRIDETGADGLTDEILDSTDVMVWWGHWHHSAVKDELVEKVAKRVGQGMGIMILHSGHYSKIFRRLMGTSCSLKWREANEKEYLWCVAPDHPIAKGLPEHIEIEREEMYGEYFDIPTPDELVYLGWFKGGETLRAGCVFRRGHGKVFYFNAGHETYPTYKNPLIRKILQNAAEYLKGEIHEPFKAPEVQPLEQL